MIKDKGLVLEPFRTRKLYNFEGTEMEEIELDNKLVQIDAMEKSEKYNILLLLCEKRNGLQLIKYIRILDLDTLIQVTEDIRLEGQTQPKAIHLCPMEKYLAISHSSGMLEIWLMETMIKREKPMAYRIFDNHANSDFTIYYHDYQPRIITLLSIKSDDFDVSKKWNTQIII